MTNYGVVPSEKRTKAIITFILHWKYLRLINMDRNHRTISEGEKAGEGNASGSTE